MPRQAQHEDGLDSLSALGGGKGQGEVGVSNAANAERPRLTRRAYFFRMYCTISDAAPAMMR
jgi:hypothetical protein